MEDTAVLTPGGAVITRPGAPTRAGEVVAARSALAPFFASFEAIQAPGSLDGGDVCEVEDHYLIAVSRRTNEEGALQLRTILARWGYTSDLIDIRALDETLHLKSGITYPGEDRILVRESLMDHPALRRYERIPVPASEAYAANCVRVNEKVLVPAGFPEVGAALRSGGYQVVPLEMSEFRKMDGGLSCLSLRF